MANYDEFSKGKCPYKRWDSKIDCPGRSPTRELAYKQLRPGKPFMWSDESEIMKLTMKDSGMRTTREVAQLMRDILPAEYCNHSEDYKTCPAYKTLTSTGWKNPPDTRTELMAKKGFF